MFLGYYKSLYRRIGYKGVISCITVPVVIVVLVLFTVAGICIGIGAHPKQGRGSLSVLTGTGTNAILGKVDPQNTEPSLSATLYETGSGDDYELYLMSPKCNDVVYAHFKQQYEQKTALTNFNRSWSVYDDNFSNGQNYFVTGQVNVTINATVKRTRKSSIIYICKFTNPDNYEQFTENYYTWMQYVKYAECKNVSVSSSVVSTTTFDITSPQFVFIGIAPSEIIDSLQYGYNTAGKNITGSNYPITCRLDTSQKTSCDFQIDTTLTDELCMIGCGVPLIGSSYVYSQVDVQYLLPKRIAIAQVITGVIIGFVALVLITFSIFVCIVVHKLEQERSLPSQAQQ